MNSGDKKQAPNGEKKHIKHDDVTSQTCSQPKMLNLDLGGFNMI